VRAKLGLVGIELFNSGSVGFSVPPCSEAVGTRASEPAPLSQWSQQLVRGTSHTVAARCVRIQIHGT